MSLPGERPPSFNPYHNRGPRRISADIARKIADHIAPNPIVYLRLAFVCQSFQEVLMADDRWRCLDTLNLKRDLAANFSARARTLDLVQIQQLIYAWTSPRGWGDPNNTTCFYTLRTSERIQWNQSKLILAEGIRQSANPDIALGYLARSHAALDVELATRISASFQLAWCAMSLNSNAIYYLHPKWRLDIDLVRCAANAGYFDISLIPKNLYKDPIILKGLAQHDQNLEVLCRHLSVDLQLALLGYNGNTLCYISDTFRDTKDVVLAALSKSPAAYEFASKRLRGDKDVVLQALSFRMERRARWLAYIPSEVLQDKEIALALLDSNSGILPQPFTGPEHVLLGKLALARDARNFDKVPDFIVERETVLKALGLPRVERQFSGEVNDPEILRAALRSGYEVDLMMLDINNADLILAAIESAAGNYLLAPFNLTSSPAFIGAALQANPACRLFALGHEVVLASHEYQDQLCHALSEGQISYHQLDDAALLPLFALIMSQFRNIALSALKGCPLFWQLLTEDQERDYDFQLALLSGREPGDVRGADFVLSVLRYVRSVPDLVGLTIASRFVYIFLEPALQSHPALIESAGIDIKWHFGATKPHLL